MTVDEVREKVFSISCVGDPERSHVMEDDLFESVLRYIADNGERGVCELAQEALKVRDLGLDRWYA